MAKRAVSNENKVLSDVSEDEISLELSYGSVPLDLKILIGNNFNTYKLSLSFLLFIFFALKYYVLIHIFPSLIRDIHKYMF